MPHEKIQVPTFGSSVCVVLFTLTLCSVAVSQEPTFARVTPTVRLIEQIKPSIVSVFTAKGAGSGTIIDRAGFIMTNHHVVQGQHGYVLLSDRTVLPYRFIGSMPERDIAIIQAVSEKPLPAIKLGRSHDVLDGESSTCKARKPMGLRCVSKTFRPEHACRWMDVGFGKQTRPSNALSQS